MPSPVVMISSYPPRLCHVASFCEEARQFICGHLAGRDVLVISHADGQGEGVYPLIDTSRQDWWRVVAAKVHELKPHVVHIQHEYGLYEYFDERGQGDGNEGFLDMLEALGDVPIVVEVHTVHGRLTDFEADFLFKMSRRADVVIFKCHYQKWRLDWTFSGKGWPTPLNIMVVPHGARSDLGYSLSQVIELRNELDLDKNAEMSEHLVGLIGWVQANRRWDILIGMWEEISETIRSRTGKKWDLLAAGTLRGPQHRAEYDKYKGQVELLEKKGLAHYYEFVPHGDNYYKMLAVCDFIVLPSTDETQTGALSRVISLCKPFITTAPMEGLTETTLESGGGLMFTNKEMLKRHVIDLACNESARLRLGNNLRKYLDSVVSWDIVTKQYDEIYQLARQAKQTGKPVNIPLEF
ncbi:MAG: hypothetical protein HZA50_02755 [Planctomycetes bacterium]|nr:hypothetical protein [Planctomycetota bacterium]